MLTPVIRVYKGIFLGKIGDGNRFANLFTNGALEEVFLQMYFFSGEDTPSSSSVVRTKGCQ